MRDQLNKGKYLFTPLKTKRKSFFQGGETKSMKMRKFTASLLAFAMLLSLVAIPVGNADAAGTTYSALSVPQLTANSTPAGLGTLVMKFDPIKDVSSAIIKFDNVDAVDPAPTVDTSGAIAAVTVSAFGTSGNEVKVEVAGSSVDTGTVYLDFKAHTGNAGDVTAKITALDGQFVSGSVVLGTIGSGSVTVTVDKVTNIAGNNNPVSLRLAESRFGALKAGKIVTLKLPDGFTFGTASYNALAGASGPVATTFSGIGTRELTVEHAGLASKGIVDLDLTIDVNDKTAKHGDVVLNVRGEQNIKFNVDELVVAKYADFGTKIEAADAKELVAGLKGKEAATITIEENAPRSLVMDRTIYLTLPSGVQWNTTNVSIVKDNSGASVDTTNTLLDSGRTLKLVIDGVSTGNAGKIKIDKPKVNTAVGFAGDVIVTVSGNAGVTGEATIAKVTAPVKVSIEKVDVKIGVQNQDVGKIVIEEQKAGALAKNGYITINFLNPYSGSFNVDNAKVTVSDSDDLAIATVSSKKVNISGGALTLKVSEKSYKKAGKIEITGVKVTLDRAVPEGDLVVEVNGDAVNESDFGGELNYVAKTALATVVTPAPGKENVVAESKFVIDAKSYTVGGVEKVMDVAPFIQDGRTMLPVRFVAEALGVSEDNIIWNAVTKQVTIMKGDRIAQMTIGSNVVVVNGVSVAMDTVAAVKDGRTVLPVRFVAQALGANIAWDEATRTVTVN